MQTRETTELEQSAFEYLNDLRDSGITNMFGARPYLMKALNLDQNISGKLLSTWMEVFNPEGNYERINASIEVIN